MNELIPLLQSLLGHDAEPVMTLVTDWAGPITWWIGLQVVFVFAGFRRGLQLALIVGPALIANTWLKWLLLEPRPYWIDPTVYSFHGEAGLGMPSGHAQGAAAFWGGLAYQLRNHQVLALALVLLALWTAITRIYLGVHSPNQVIVGFTLGAVWLALSLCAWPRVERFVTARSSLQLLIYLCIALFATYAVTTLVLHMRADTAIPTAWIDGYNRVAAPESQAASADEMSLFADGATPLSLLVAGFALGGLLHRHWPAQPQRLPPRWMAAALSVGLNLLLLSGVSWALPRFGSALLLPIALFQPLLCVYLPLRVCALFEYRALTSRQLPAPRE